MNDCTGMNLMGLDSGINVCVPFEVINYLAHDGNYKNPSRFTKIEAFEYLLMMHMNSLMNERENGMNIAKLTQALCWSRASVQKFINILKDLNVLEVMETKKGKMVCLKEDIFNFKSSTQELYGKDRTDDSQSQSPLQHISSRETKGNFSKRK